MQELSEKLRTLVDYWIEHNQEHEEETRQWAEKASALDVEVARVLRAAADDLAQAVDRLKQARQALQGRSSQ